MDDSMLTPLDPPHLVCHLEQRVAGGEARSTGEREFERYDERFDDRSFVRPLLKT